jgi:hypothetical protein
VACRGGAQDGPLDAAWIEEVARDDEHAGAARTLHRRVDRAPEIGASARFDGLEVAEQPSERVSPSVATSTWARSDAASARYPTLAATRLAARSFVGSPVPIDALASTTRRTTASSSARNSFTIGSPVRAKASQSSRRGSSP